MDNFSESSLVRVLCDEGGETADAGREDLAKLLPIVQHILHEWKAYLDFFRYEYPNFRGIWFPIYETEHGVRISMGNCGVFDIGDGDLVPQLSLTVELPDHQQFTVPGMEGYLDGDDDVLPSDSEVVKGLTVMSYSLDPDGQLNRLKAGHYVSDRAGVNMPEELISGCRGQIFDRVYEALLAGGIITRRVERPND